MSEPDLLFAGAGHNSLITAAYLARSGMRVHVLEGHERIGGDTITEELTPGRNAAHAILRDLGMMSA